MAAIVEWLAGAWLAVAVHLWQSTLVLLPLFLLARWLRSAPARLADALWTAALIKLLLPLSLCGRLVRLLAARLHLDLPGAVGAGAESTLAAVGPILDPRAALATSPSSAGGIAAALVLAGSAVWLVAALWRIVRLTRAQARADSPCAAHLSELAGERRTRLEEALVGTGVPPRRVVVCGDQEPPRVAGLLRPRILLPAVILDALDVHELRAILLHEDAHRRRFDPLRGAAQRLIAAPLFFYPLLGPLLRRLRHSAELVCDERVLGAGVPAPTYTSALSRTVQSCLLPAPEILGAGSLLRQRLERIAHPRRFRTMTRHRLILGLAVLLLAAGTFLPLQLGVAEEEIEFDEPPKIVKMIPPEYPEEARDAKVEGDVVLLIEVLSSGELGEVEVAEEVEGHPELTEAALAVVPLWRFEPAKKDGEPVDCKVHIPISFKLDSGVKEEKKGD